MDKNYPKLLTQMKEVSLDRLMESLGHANLSMVWELYANLNHKHDHAGVRGERVNLSREDLCNYFGV